MSAIRDILLELIRELKYTGEHPIHRLPTDEELAALLELPDGQQRLLAGLEERERDIQAAIRDPLNAGWKPPFWLQVDALMQTNTEGWVLGGNNSTKSWLLAWWGVKNLIEQPGIDWGFWHETEDSSINQQQELVHRFLPPQYRELGKISRSVDVSYTRKNGFGQNRFCLPNGSRGFFFFYKQEVSTITGYKLSGACCDELLPMEHLEELRSRLVGRGGKILIGFTPIEGYSLTVGEALTGAEVVEWRPTRLLEPNKVHVRIPGAPAGQMPYLLKCRRPGSFVLFAFSEFNKFATEQDLALLKEGRTPEQQRMRVCGWVEKSAGTAIGKFSTKIHVVPRVGEAPCGPVPPNPWETLYPRLAQWPGTNYVSADGAGTKNWVIKWYRVAEAPGGERFVFVYREWPDRYTHGDWAVPGRNPDGDAGPAQRSGFGGTYNFYKNLVLTLEGWRWNEQDFRWDDSEAEEIETRYLDPRFAGTEQPGADDTKTPIESMAAETFDQGGRLLLPSLRWVKAPGGGGSIEHERGLAEMNQWFDYDLGRTVDAFNTPHWFVVEDCEQSINAYRAYTGKGGPTGGWKDFMDPDWYFIQTDPWHVSDKARQIWSPYAEVDD